MAQIGDMEFPELTFSEALAAIEAIKAQKIQTVEGLAKTMGHASPNSGSFFVKAAALNKYYGLVDQSKTDVSLTSTAKAILYGMDNEKQEARRTAIFRVPLLKALYEKLGQDYNRDEFRPILKSITGAAPEDLATRAPRVEKIYQDAVRYLPPNPGARAPDPGASPTNGSSAPSTPSPTMDTAVPSPSQGVRASDFLEFKDGGTFLRIPKNDVTQLEQIKSMVDLWLEVAKKKATVTQEAKP